MVKETAYACVGVSCIRSDVWGILCVDNYFAGTGQTSVLQESRSGAVQIFISTPYTESGGVGVTLNLLPFLMKYIIKRTVRNNRY